MASLRPQAISHGMSRALIMITAIPIVVLQPIPRSTADGGHGNPGESANGWADPYGYHVGAGLPPAARSMTPGDRRAGRSGLGGSNGPTYCKEAAVGARIADPLAVMTGTAVTCGGTNSAAPTMTPQLLAQQQWKDLRLPLPHVLTAPPRGAAGLVGLPEWVWIPRGQWRLLSKRAAAGGVWAQVTARPERLSVEPGAGLAARRCAGPGTAYDPSRSASVQHTDCSYTYGRSSASQPGAVYRVRVTVVWSGAWVGSGGAGGALPDLSRSSTFSLRVGEAQGLYG